MPARVMSAVLRFVRWRWSPFYGLLGASLLYVALAILLIPEELGAAPESPEPGDPVEVPTGTDSDPSAIDTTPTSLDDAAGRSTSMMVPPQTGLTPAQVTMPRPPRRRGFSPPLDRPEPPAAPPPPVIAPAAAPPPAMDPTAQAALAASRAGRRASARAAQLAPPQLRGTTEPAGETLLEEPDREEAPDADNQAPDADNQAPEVNAPQPATHAEEDEESDDDGDAEEEAAEEPEDEE